MAQNISIHALREEGDILNLRSGEQSSISIHALREEGDTKLVPLRKLTAISIHALREEGDRNGRRRKNRTKNFYPRPPRGGRLGYNTLAAIQQDFYPRPPRGGRLDEVLPGDTFNVFLSTPSARRATSQGGGQSTSMSISIHALREEGDSTTTTRNSQI